MDHTEFVKAWNAKSRNIYVDRQKALRVFSQKILPKKYQYAHLFWTIIWLLSFPAGILIMIFHKWWTGLIFLALIPTMLSSAAKKAAMDFIVEYALDDPAFYNYAVGEGIIDIK